MMFVKNHHQWNKNNIFQRQRDEVLEQNENLKEVSNWGEIYRYIKEMQSK